MIKANIWVFFVAFTYFTNILLSVLIYSSLIEAKLLPSAHTDKMSMESFVCILTANWLTTFWLLCHFSIPLAVLVDYILNATGVIERCKFSAKLNMMY